LTVHNLSKIFTTGGLVKKLQTFTAVDAISFSLDSGEILGLLGPNGAGKTTTIQMLLGLLTPTSGSIEYFGKNFYEHRTEIMQQVTFASSYLKLPGSLSIYEALSIYSKLYGIPKNSRVARIEHSLELFGLTTIKDRLIKKLSAGQLTRTMLAKAFLPQPKIVLLDEPTAALDPDIAQQVRTFILEQRRTVGVSVLFTSHNMTEVEEICDRVLIIKQGKILASETPAKLAATVKSAKVRLFVTHNREQLLAYAQEQNIPYSIPEQTTGKTIEFSLDEQDIAAFLSDIAYLQVKYSQISIDKPTLEDYFLEIAR
jgi:ABC-2 type transport system ATP-binding protein